MCVIERRFHSLPTEKCQPIHHDEYVITDPSPLPLPCRRKDHTSVLPVFFTRYFHSAAVNNLGSKRQYPFVQLSRTPRFVKPQTWAESCVFDLSNHGARNRYGEYWDLFYFSRCTRSSSLRRIIALRFCRIVFCICFCIIVYSISLAGLWDGPHNDRCSVPQSHRMTGIKRLQMFYWIKSLFYTPYICSNDLHPRSSF